ncbi:DUF3857 domain-containing protein [Flavobacterium sp. 3HN19-14]|uniref:DUF3857 domain-containing protein n=1 Tax=Flavobacterium sp. 3HN19-14 TaxID=3448133 RepID=UPI003EE4021C
MKSLFYCCLFIGVTLSAIGQKPEYTALLIPEELKENANAVIRLDELNVNISSQRDMTITSKTVTTILNEQGMQNLDLSAYYDKNRKVSKIEAKFYDAFGKEIKSVKRKDFRDVSVGDGFSIFNDNRTLYYDYTPVNYPFTVVFETVTETSNTAFLPKWLPVDGYYVSTLKSNVTVTFPESLGFKAKEVNFAPKYNIQKTESSGQLSYTASNVHAMKGEESSPEFMAIAPIVYMKLEKFNLEGVDGEAKNWQEFGKWYYDNLLVGTDELPVETQNKVKQLVGAEKDPVAIAKIIYKYVQDKTRYVSVQIGIGGFKPMLAKDVDKLGYGDCKALSNYTRALLEVVGVPSYYTVAYAGTTDPKRITGGFRFCSGKSRYSCHSGKE